MLKVTSILDGTNGTFASNHTEGFADHLSAECDLVFEQTRIEECQVGTEIIDAHDWDWRPTNSDMITIPDVDYDHDVLDVEVGQDSFLKPKYDKSQWLPQSCAACSEARTTKDPHDYEDSLRIVTLVYSPLWNIVHRSQVCGCRLGGDSSPFTLDFDFMEPVPCRLHFFDQLCELEGIELTKPAEGYDPEQDPYFDRFGGHLAFACFIVNHPVVRRSIDTYKLLPVTREAEGFAKFEEAWQDEEKRGALLEWRRDMEINYFKWRKRYGEESKARVAELIGQTKGLTGQKQRKRRDSF